MVLVLPENLAGRRRRLYASIIAVDRCGFWFHQIFAAAAIVFMQVSSPPQAQSQAQGGKANDNAKELHMFMWSSSASPVSKGGTGGLHVFGVADLQRRSNPIEQEVGGEEVMVKTVKNHGEDGEEQGEEGTF
ncbi:auxin efflux carrier component 7-like isoform X1 [Senna tora]|uniref:Auxin efflux carrier component 7-like isoform X1 n=1 Tax=Senna tora TaxID=362788 RepID=A0A834WGV5_9FABA|nr:auxin efflux carrier component 7-like isoform X1 [Senna tora]